jgi:membrane protease YdiL (CAAX protease family)
MKVNLLLGNLFKWKPQKISFIGFAIGIVIILLSIAMIYTKKIIFLNIFIRDIVMILLFGIGIPLFMINKEKEFTDYGLHFKKWYIFLPINLILGVLLLLMLLKESPLPSGFIFTDDMIWKIIYIMLAGIFETVVFYSFIRTAIERCFGIIPAILVATIFYSFHHAGFQPEFLKLIFVGLLYAVTFRIGNSALLIFPFFWGVGGCYDVLIQSTEVSEIVYPEIRSVIIFLGIIVIITCLIMKNNKTNRGRHNGI